MVICWWRKEEKKQDGWILEIKIKSNKIDFIWSVIGDEGVDVDGGDHVVFIISRGLGKKKNFFENLDWKN